MMGGGLAKVSEEENVDLIITLKSVKSVNVFFNTPPLTQRSQII